MKTAGTKNASQTKPTGKVSPTKKAKTSEGETKGSDEGEEIFFDEEVPPPKEVADEDDDDEFEALVPLDDVAGKPTDKRNKLFCACVKGVGVFVWMMKRGSESCFPEKYLTDLFLGKATVLGAEEFLVKKRALRMVSTYFNIYMSLCIFSL